MKRVQFPAPVSSSSSQFQLQFPVPSSHFPVPVPNWLFKSSLVFTHVAICSIWMVTGSLRWLCVAMCCPVTSKWHWPSSKIMRIHTGLNWLRVQSLFLCSCYDCLTTAIVTRNWSINHQICRVIFTSTNNEQGKTTLYHAWTWERSCMTSTADMEEGWLTCNLTIGWGN